MQSASQHLDVIDKYIQAKLEENHSPFPSNLAPSVHINCFGVIPKKHQAGKWQLITDLFFSRRASINNAIDSMCSMRYITVDQVAQQAVYLGKGCLLAKIDIKAAYHSVPVSPDQCHYLGMSWKNQTYVDSMLPFGPMISSKNLQRNCRCLGMVH